MGVQMRLCPFLTVQPMTSAVTISPFVYNNASFTGLLRRVTELGQGLQPIVVRKLLYIMTRHTHNIKQSP